MQHRGEVLFNREEIQEMVKSLGSILTEDYKDKNLMVISLLKGAFVFTADLIREIKLPLVVEFMITSSYVDKSTKSTGFVSVLQDVNRDITSFDILIVDDIIDSGYTMKHVYDVLSSRGPKSIKTCTLLDKPVRRQTPFKCDYVGTTVDDHFIVGYGLNLGDYYRNEDHIFIYKE